MRVKGLQRLRDWVQAPFVPGRAPKIEPRTYRDVLNMDSLFTISPGRSGTKALTDFLARYTDLYCEHAPKPWLATAGYLYHQGRVDRQFVTGAFYTSREPYFLKALRAGRVFFDGDCKNLPIVEVIADLLPRSKFIHLVRSPSRFIASGLSRGYFGVLPAELWGHLEPDVRPALSLRERVQKIACFWEASNLIAERLKHEVGEARVRTIVAEEFFRQPEALLDEVNALFPSVVVRSARHYRIRKLNQQRSDHLERCAISIIEEAVEEFCPSRRLYFFESSGNE